ncbi:hypothetical protein CBR_g12607 [Chara braunii]|uniref:Integrase catalytic domain-containing protein n=1 Tax=Chara braunii TaxID=69332 RepID=A0A388KS67_CHABU|nr:hypothetical protein CBR_g12607 [Chara braunii]|eukprot:GBG72887.1 hypothetical protein CBR_g12607 [Chara braunii]
MVASYPEGSATICLSGYVQLQGYGHDFLAWAVNQKLEDFLKLVEERWRDPQEAPKATDVILTLSSRSFKSVRDATDTVERLICVPGMRYDPQVLLTTYLRCLPMPLRNQLAGKANINVHNFPSFSKRALDLEAKIGHGHQPMTDGRKKAPPPNWKAKGRIMFVDNDDSTIKLDDDFQEGVGSEADNVEALGGGAVAASVKKDPDKPFMVTTNASQYGIGVVLAQQEGPKLRPVEYMLKKMPSQKLAKSTYEKELYVIYKALTHWRHYLLGRFFHIRTDHQTLKWMRTQLVLSDALKRWIEVIEQYDFETRYIKGEYNGVADALSCRPNFLGALITEFRLADDVTRSLVEACREDPFMGEIIRRLEAKDKVTSAAFELVNGLLFLKKAGNKRLFGKYARLLAMPATTKTEYVIKLFKENWVRDFGLPKSIVSDRDVRFTSELWKAAAAEQGTQLQMTSRNHPEANGQAEQLNRAVQHLLRHYIKPNQVDWDEKLALIASLYNNAVHSATGRAVEQMHKAQAAVIESENKHRRPSTFQVGDRVWVKSSELGQEHGISRKLMPQYFGPWEVLDIVGDVPDGPSYVVQIPGHRRTYPVFHASKLAPFRDTDQFSSRRSMLPPTMDGEVDIDDIVDHRELPVPRPTGRGRPPKPKLQYRVWFRHHTDPKEDRSFTREELMQTAPQVVANYEKLLQKGKRQIE